MSYSKQHIKRRLQLCARKHGYTPQVDRVENFVLKKREPEFNLYDMIKIVPRKLMQFFGGGKKNLVPGMRSK